MTERASIFQTIQVGVETTPGTAVAALKKLTALSIEPAVNAEMLPFRAIGNKFRSLVVPGKEWVMAPLSGLATYTELVYPLSSVVSYAAPTQQGATAAYKWEFEPDTDAEDTVKTFTVEQGSGLRAHRFTYGMVTGLRLEFSRNGIEISGEMIGKALEDDVQLSTNEVQTLSVTGGTPESGNFKLTFEEDQTDNISYDATAADVEAALETLDDIDEGDVVCTGGPFPGTAIAVEFRGQYLQTDASAITAEDTFNAGDVTVTQTTTGAAPTTIDLEPIIPTQVDVYLADTQAGLDEATALERVLTVSWELRDRFGTIFPLATAASTGFAATVETEPNLEIKLKMEADDEGMDLLTNMRAGSSTYLRIEATGDTIEGEYDYALQIDTACKVSAVSPFSDEEGVFAIEWTLTGVHDSTWGKATAIELINDLSAL
jgi:hypothetical protein